MTGVHWAMGGVIGRWAAWCVVAGLALAGCTATETGNPEARSTIEPAVGGKVVLGSSSVVFDPGDLPGHAPVTVRMIQTDDAAPSEYDAYSPIYRFEPSMTFERPAEVCLAASEAPADASLFWSKADGDGYEAIGTHLADGKACGQVTHFSTGFVGRLRSVQAADGGVSTRDTSATDAPNADASAHSDASGMADAGPDAPLGSADGGVGDGANGPSQEICDNASDDDGDGAVDCSDPDCLADVACQTTPKPPTILATQSPGNPVPASAGIFYAFSIDSACGWNVGTPYTAIAIDVGVRVNGVLASPAAGDVTINPGETMDCRGPDAARPGYFLCRALGPCGSPILSGLRLWSLEAGDSNVEIEVVYTFEMETAPTSESGSVTWSTTTTAQSPTATPTVIVDTFDADGSFSEASLIGASTANDTFLGIRSTASALQFTVTGGAFNLTSITLPIAFMGTGPGDTLRVLLVKDSGGLPGATIEVLSESRPIWPPDAGALTTKTVLISAVRPLLLAGQSYWIVTEPTAIPTAAGQFQTYYWFDNSGLATSPFRQKDTEDVLPYLRPWSEGVSGEAYLALRVEGTPAAAQ